MNQKSMPPSAPTNVRLVEDQGCGEVWIGWTQSTDDADPQYAIEYEIYVNGVLSPLPVGGGIDRDFVYATAQGDNTFVVKAVDRAGNTSEPSNAFTAFTTWAMLRFVWSKHHDLCMRLLRGYLAEPYTFHVNTSSASLSGRSVGISDRRRTVPIMLPWGDIEDDWHECSSFW
jgi:hypothetical protein